MISHCRGSSLYVCQPGCEKNLTVWFYYILYTEDIIGLYTCIDQATYTNIWWVVWMIVACFWECFMKSLLIKCIMCTQNTKCYFLLGSTTAVGFISIIIITHLPVMHGHWSACCGCFLSITKKFNIISLLLHDFFVLSVLLFLKLSTLSSCATDCQPGRTSTDVLISSVAK